MRELIYLLLHIHPTIISPFTIAPSDAHFLPGSKVHHSATLPIAHAHPTPTPSRPRSGLAVPLPQRPIAFEVIPIHHATNDRQLSAHPFTMYSIYLIPIFEATRRQWERMQETERKRGVGGVCILCGQYRLCSVMNFSLALRLGARRMGGCSVLLYFVACRPSRAMMSPCRLNLCPRKEKIVHCMS